MASDRRGGGALADRLDRRRLLWAIDSARALVAGGFAVAVAAGLPSIPLLAIVCFMLGCGQTLYSGAWPGLIQALVDTRST